MTSSFEILLAKLEKFIKRYYKDLIIRGVLYFVATVSIVFLTYILLEYYGYFSSLLRGILFYSFIGVTVYLFVRFIVIPSLKLFKIGKVLDEEEAAKIVGKHFKGLVDDKIVNIIQLHRFINEKDSNVDLLIAGINQKSEQLINVRFEKVVNYGKNLKYFYWALGPAAVVVALIIFSPFVIVDSASRIIKYDTHYERPVPFEVILENDTLKAFYNEDFNFKFSVKGSVLPDEASVKYDDVEYLADQTSKTYFKYTFNNVQRPKEFFVHAAGHRFGPYELEVVPKPLINNFVFKVNSPDYTNKEDQVYRNYGDIRVAEGSEVNMRFNTRYTDEMKLKIDDETVNLEQVEKGVYQYKIDAFESFNCKVFTSNEHTDHGDSLSYKIDIIPDQYPEIIVNQHEDSVLLAHRFFTGNIRDDYGFDRLKFKYRISSGFDIDDETDYKNKPIDIDNESTNQIFTYHFNLNKIGIEPGEHLEYHFAVWDNDRINGPKKARSQNFSYRVPDHDEIAESSRKTFEEISEEMSTSILEVSEGRDEIDKLRRQLLEKDNIGWEEKESFEDILDKHEIVKDRFEELSRKKRESEERYEQFKEQDKRIKKKQEELQKIFDEVASDEMHELMNRIREELEKLGRDEMYKSLEDLDFELSQFEMQINRALELYKMLQFETMLNETLESLERLSDDQKGLMDDMSLQDPDAEDNFERQEDIKDRFDNLSEQLEDLNLKTQELQRPQNMPDTRDVQHNIDYDLQKALEQMMQQNMDGTMNHQQESLRGMDQLSDMLTGFQQSLFSDDLAEDARVIRQILQNLLRTSFNQEDLMAEVGSININDPRYLQLIRDQRRISDDMRVVEDSLIALSKRQASVQSYINREVAQVNMNVEKAINDLIERRRHNARSRQQYVMMHVNNLALMLNESLQDIQMQMGMQEGFGDPQAGGQGVPSFQDIIDMQEAANQMLEQMREGHQPMEGETGEEMSLSEQLSRMSAQQEAIRNELRKLTEELKKDHQVGTGELEELQQKMEQTEKDIVTDNISERTTIRQDRILSRLLEHRDALIERDYEEDRVGEVPEFYELSNPEEIFEYNKLRDQEVEMLKRKEIKLNRFYKELVDKYFIKFR